MIKTLIAIHCHLPPLVLEEVVTLKLKLEPGRQNTCPKIIDLVSIHFRKTDRKERTRSFFRELTQVRFISRSAVVLKHERIKLIFDGA